MKRILSVLLMALGLGLVATSPAQAVPSDCASGEFCLHQNSSSPYFFADYWPGSWPRNTCTDIALGGISYVYNRTGTRWFIFRDSNCAGAKLEVGPHYATPITLLVNGEGWDNDPVAVMRTSYTY